jgi:hypothetical protein
MSPFEFDKIGANLRQASLFHAKTGYARALFRPRNHGKKLRQASLAIVNAAPLTIR